jgi:hypothetical protein
MRRGVGDDLWVVPCGGEGWGRDVGPGRRSVTGSGFESKENKSNSIQFKRFQNASNFDHQKCPSRALKFEVNYGFEALKK